MGAGSAAGEGAGAGSRDEAEGKDEEAEEKDPDEDSDSDEDDGDGDGPALDDDDLNLSDMEEVRSCPELRPGFVRLGRRRSRVGSRDPSILLASLSRARAFYFSCLCAPFSGCLTESVSRQLVFRVRSSFGARLWFALG